jgi:hypothetical protein
MRILDRCSDGGKGFDPYFVPDDWGRLQYGRLLWANRSTRLRLLSHWSDPRHPYCERFATRYRCLVERVLEGDPQQDAQLDAELRAEGSSLRTVIREIPPVFGEFY